MVDYLILTFIREEYVAVRKQFVDSNDALVGTTRVSRVTTRSGQSVSVAVARAQTQGTVAAQDAARELIEEQGPRLVVAVGIAGAVPSADVFLGDVVLANDIRDLTRTAEDAAGRHESPASTHLAPAVRDYVANVTVDDFPEWQDDARSIDRPDVTEIGHAWTGDAGWNDAINNALKANQVRDRPDVVDGVLASSDVLVKSWEFMAERLRVDRRILANEMEAAGVARACERMGVPLLVVRGVSDIVGHRRSDDWKLYACEVVGSFVRALVSSDCVEAIESKVPGLSGTSKSVNDSLSEQLAQIRTGKPEESASRCRTAFSLFKRLPEELKRLRAPELFDALDRPMKYLGDKSLVLEVAEACIESCVGTDVNEATAECEARARICGTSWVYQRTGKLGAAEQEAQRSLEISELLHLSKSLAFCRKCMGRLKRLRAEAETDGTVKVARYHESVRLLTAAVSDFGELGDEAEVGDCYSLLGRTHLSAGDFPLARDCIKEARRRIVPGSKDYLDLRILEGDAWSAKRENERALEAYEEVIELTSQGDYQLSEIVARAHYQRAKTLVRMGRRQDAADGFAAAQSIWERYGEQEVAAEAEWARILASGMLQRRVIRLLEKHGAPVRCRAVRLYREEQSRQKGRAVAQRIGSDDAVWRNLVRRAERQLGLRSQSG